MRSLRRILLTTLIAISLLPFGYFDGFHEIRQNKIEARFSHHGGTHHGGGHHHSGGHHKKHD